MAWAALRNCVQSGEFLGLGGYLGQVETEAQSWMKLGEQSRARAWALVRFARSLG